MTGRRIIALCLAAFGGTLTILLPGAAAPAAPAPVGLIAFETPAGIHLINADGTGLRRLPGTKPHDQNPRWSPDGTQIVFWSDAIAMTNVLAIGEIYVIDADGSNRRRLTKDDADFDPSDQFPAWSPDGRLIAFESLRIGEWHIWLMSADGTDIRRLTPNIRGGFSPHWSPDGKRIAYTAADDWTAIGIVDLSGRTQAVKTLSMDEDWAPSWSPDGSQIAFTSTAQHKKGEIHVVGAEGGTPTRLTRNQVIDLDPHWSPDGEHILFSSGRAGFDEVFIMNADGTDQRRITRIPTEYACCADWRPEPQP